MLTFGMPSPSQSGGKWINKWGLRTSILTIKASTENNNFSRKKHVFTSEHLRCISWQPDPGGCCPVSWKFQQHIPKCDFLLSTSQLLTLPGCSALCLQGIHVGKDDDAYGFLFCERVKMSTGRALNIIASSPPIARFSLNKSVTGLHCMGIGFHTMILCAQQLRRPKS